MGVLVNPLRTSTCEQNENGFSFYNYPIAFEYELHQPLDSVTNIYVNNNKGVSYEKKLRSYIKILFDF